MIAGDTTRFLRLAVTGLVTNKHEFTVDRTIRIGTARASLGAFLPRVVRAAGRSGSFLLGLAFAAAWTPCIGIVLGSILALAATSSDPIGATALLLSYSAGLGLPFVLIALVAARGDGGTPRILSSLRRGTRTAGRLGGVLVALIGVAIAAGLLPLMARYLPGLPGL